VEFSKGKQIEDTHVSRSKTRSNEYKHIQFNRATEYDSAPGDIRINPGPNLWTDFPAKLIKKEKLLPTEKENLPPNFLLLCLLSVRSESERYLLSFIPLETFPYTVYICFGYRINSRQNFPATICFSSLTKSLLTVKSYRVTDESQ